MVSLRFSKRELADRRMRIVDFIAAQIETAGSNGALVGLSGGVDSSLVASLAVEALGQDAVLGISMPAAVSAPRHRDDADRLADELGIPYATVDVEPIVEAVDAGFPDGEMSEFARGNARARTRGVMSYAIANEQDRLVLGTGNRTESLVGYFTKYGDGAVDCHPIGNLYKCQVRQLARAVELPENIVEKTPTAELWEDQTDEGELGISYDVLDPILALHVDGPLSVSATAETVGCEVETVERVDALVAQSAHKRALPPSP